MIGWWVLVVFALWWHSRRSKQALRDAQAEAFAHGYSLAITDVRAYQHSKESERP